MQCSFYCLIYVPAHMVSTSVSLVFLVSNGIHISFKIFFESNQKRDKNTSIVLLAKSVLNIVEKKDENCARVKKKKKNRTKNSKRGKIEKIKLIKHGERNGINTIL